MSVNEVPGWLVAMAPSAIGVPVAATPGLVPHCDVLTAAVLGVLDAVDVLWAWWWCRPCCYCYCYCCSRPPPGR